MEKKYTTCHLCSGGRPIVVHTDKGRLVSAERRPDTPRQFKYFCPKLKAAPEIVYSPKRLKTPLIRDSRKGTPDWKESSWDQALDLVAERFESIRARYGAQALCWVAGHVPDYGAPWDYANRFMSVFGSPNIIGNGSICHAAREAAHVLTYGAMTSPDYGNAKCILLWGKNDRNTNPAGYNLILEARKKGAKLIVIDPRRTKQATLADIWLQIRPGCDGLLAMSMIHVLISEGLYDPDFVKAWTVGFEALKQAALAHAPERVASRMWLNPKDIRQAARLYAKTKPACMADGNGLDMHLDVSQNMRAVCILRALSGNLDKMGGDLIAKPLPVRDIKLKERLPAHVTPISFQYPLFNKYHPARGDHTLGSVVDAILEERPYPIKGLVLQGTNPAVTLAHSARAAAALKKVPFRVVIDLFMTRTAKLAHVVLPTTTPFETTQFNLRALSAHHVTLQDQVIGWHEECRPDWKIIFDLARRMGFEKDFPWTRVEEAIDYQLEPSGLTVEALRKNPGGIVYEEIRYEKYRAEGFRTPTGKIELASEHLKAQGYPPVPLFDAGVENHLTFHDRRADFPFIGISGARSNRYIHSQYRNIPSLLKREPEPFVDIHPKDAESLGVCEGERVSIETPNGRIKMRARVSDIVHPGSLRIAWGWGECNDDYNINNLTDDSEHDPMISTTSNRCFMCRVVRVNAASAQGIPKTSA